MYRPNFGKKLLTVLSTKTTQHIDHYFHMDWQPTAASGAGSKVGRRSASKTSDWHVDGVEGHNNAVAAAAHMAGTQVAGLQDTARTASKRVPLGTPLVASLLGDGSEGGVKKRQPAH